MRTYHREVLENGARRQQFLPKYALARGKISSSPTAFTKSSFLRIHLAAFFAGHLADHDEGLMPRRGSLGNGERTRARIVC
jgi:hypothetical protein